MIITWACHNCGVHQKLSVCEDDPRAAALTALAGDDIIECSREGHLLVHLLCEDCLEAASPEEESEIHFLQAPQLH